MRVLNNRRTDRHTDGTDSITSTSDAGGNETRVSGSLIICNIDPRSSGHLKQCVPLKVVYCKTGKFCNMKISRIRAIGYFATGKFHDFFHIKYLCTDLSSSCRVIISAQSYHLRNWVIISARRYHLCNWIIISVIELSSLRGLMISVIELSSLRGVIISVQSYHLRAELSSP